MKVYFTSDFGEGDKNMQEGRLLDIKSVFRCNGYEWLVPAAYCFEEGISVDICRRIPIAEVKEFFEKWPRMGRIGLTVEQRNERRAADPFGGHCKFDLHVNGNKMKGEGWSGTSWYGTDDGREDEDAGELLEAYELDRDSAWSFYRARFRWPEGAEEIRMLHLTVTAYADMVPCGCRFISAVGCAPFDVEFTHPITHEPLRLHVLSCERASLKREQMEKRGGFIYPDNYCMLKYNVEPDGASAKSVAIRDCKDSDKPAGKGTSASSCHIIGGGCGIIALSDSDIRTACSSIYFEEQKQIEWYVSVNVIPFESQIFTLAVY
ncbi:hypothetical protein V3C10_08660 [[Clostridium] symbiosum]|uniref:hypothetical protein n=1 Tax=Clostridium symbiosum TaxID=1512 RepID=UPI001D09075F|nr:hypothetical protein [[Clostridium] symbiosum]MCB6609465.1 hypothetical protein [[Clostridium] symbiosum]MCB6929163.1 hypothetical protein [[Clostridium] symbiosum]